MEFNETLHSPEVNFYHEHPELQTVFPTRQPDIEWVPEYSKYLARQEKRKATENLQTHLPFGWPQKVEGPEVWDGNKFKTENGGLGDATWVVHFAPSHIRDFERALAYYRVHVEMPLGYVNRKTFPLSEDTIKFLRNCSKRIHQGDGLLVLRGLNPDKYDAEENAVIYAGLSSYIGDRRGFQSRFTKEVMIHIKDTGKTLTPNPMASYTNQAQPFHSDLGDILGLYALEVSETGGTSHVASTAQVYNEIAATRPDIIHTLSSLWVIDGYDYTKDPAYMLRPLLFHEDGHVILNYARRLFTGVGTLTRSQYLPAISEAQAEALDALEFTARKVGTSMMLQKGDIQFQNNLATVHGRDGFEDGDSKRHLLRLWLQDDEYAWKVPPALMGEWNGVFDPTKKPEDEVFPDAPTRAGATDTTTSCS
ncbi:Clavaminate synthase-like protein [Glonium stellatum]|uniref:Clavaminate synthase-like protein n=1 Tax=Glonium stellatum TaxID=574774 RepID=A0A8E2FDX2_9PEZI|nr:Clavaminate synthase-like protein [Glonium stellatum]